jgi:hypothetical protein
MVPKKLAIQGEYVPEVFICGSEAMEAYSLTEGIIITLNESGEEMIKG